MALKKIGSFWKSDKGKTVLRGNADREGITIPPNAKLLVFKNDKGDNPKRPDFTLHVADDDQPGADPGQAAIDDAWGSRKPADVESDDVPFSVVALLPFLGMAAWIA
jgi:hypothetical protein